jgi:hypothetical protein
VEAEMAEVVRQREALAENDPRHLLQQARHDHRPPLTTLGRR